MGNQGTREVIKMKKKKMIEVRKVIVRIYLDGKPRDKGGEKNE